jgi:hypothetical protein
VDKRVTRQITTTARLLQRGSLSRYRPAIADKERQYIAATPKKFDPLAHLPVQSAFINEGGNRPLT